METGDHGVHLENAARIAEVDSRPEAEDVTAQNRLMVEEVALDHQSIECPVTPKAAQVK